MPLSRSIRNPVRVGPSFGYIAVVSVRYPSWASRCGWRWRQFWYKLCSRNGLPQPVNLLLFFFYLFGLLATVPILFPELYDDRLDLIVSVSDA